MSFDATSLIESIRAANLEVYRASPTRLREDVGSEAEIAHDYQGRLIYELLQNADDAMADAPSHGDRIRFRLTDRELWVANTGRALTEADVRGLTSTGAGTKTASGERRRASIGHKGMGFKSVLELTDQPEVYSTTCAFLMDARRAQPPVASVMASIGETAPERVPIMRFPWELDESPPEWERARADGFNTLFRFPFPEGQDPAKKAGLADALLSLPVTTILFLKHLEQVDVEVVASGRLERFSWRLERERRNSDGGWAPCVGLLNSGVYRVWVKSDGPDDIWSFLLAHDADVAIGSHRGGLNAYAWEGVEVTEVTVAALQAGGASDVLPDDWRRFHVFLPTAEPCPYGFLVNAAFATDISRQEIRLGPGSDDYNGFLIEAAARTLRDQLFPEYLSLGSKGLSEVLSLLDRGAVTDVVFHGGDPAEALHRALVSALANYPILQAESPDEPPIAFANAVVPTIIDSTRLGDQFRDVLPARAVFEGWRFPAGSFCSGRLARIAVDHGVKVLTPSEVAVVLSGTARERAVLAPHSSGKLRIDPVFAILETLWSGVDAQRRRELEQAVRIQPLFPVSIDEQGFVERIRINDTTAFYPPRSLHGEVPLDGLVFLLQDICWGSLTPPERTELLADQMSIWGALFGLREFKFPDVMRASVLPLLDLESSGSDARQQLADVDKLAAICKLSGPTPTPAHPLPYERLGSQRALYNLCRLPVPCRIDGGDVQWIPAYRVYFGRDWDAESSVEVVLSALEPVRRAALKVPILVERSAFSGLLARYHGLESADTEPNDDTEEVGLEEDDEQPTESDEFTRWRAFLTWLGVNHTLRPVHFHDAEDQATGWLKTERLAHPGGWAFKTLDNIWDQYAEQVATKIQRLPAANESTPYFYRVHDLEYLREILPVAQSDTNGALVQALYRHLALGWSRLEHFAQAEIALVPQGRWPNSRTKPPRAQDDEIHLIGDDFWLYRLRRSSFCPTTHGPRRPEQAWLHSAEIERRFGRRGSNAGDLMPILKVSTDATDGKARGFAQALGVRDTITPSNFTLADAGAFTSNLALLYESNLSHLNDATLRQRIRPAYRNLFELLSGVTERLEENEPTAGPALGDALLLIHDGAEGFRFERAADVLYAKRGGQRELLGITAALWTFILEATPAAERPLRTIFGARVLEEVLLWNPQPGEASLTETGLVEFRAGLADIAPYLLARLRVERGEETQAARDLSAVRSFIAQVEPVESLEVRCELDKSPLPVARDRLAYVGTSTNGLCAYVKWGSTPWSIPLSPAEAEALAAAVTDLLQVGYFESILALLSAPVDGRNRLLQFAGASSFLDIARHELFSVSQEPPVVDETAGPKVVTTVGEDTANDASALSPRPWERQLRAVPRTPLFRPEDLSFDGAPIIVHGLPRRDAGSTGPSPGATDRGGRIGNGLGTRYGGGTDLDELDRLGMSIAMTYESRRLRRQGLDAEIFDSDKPSEAAAVFDVSTPGAIDQASKKSPRFEQAFAALENHGISRDAPGFDILTLEGSAPHQLGRLIELKSSGNNARIQSMSWNEWKTARASSLRGRFHLYLVGNLRSDLQDAAPFLLDLCDPVGSLFATEKNDQQCKRSVQLNVQEFIAAERQVLTVRPAATTNTLSPTS